MNFMEIFWIVWMFVLPILGITLSVLMPLVWFFIVPKVARMLTWSRFRNVSIHAIADDSGYVELVPTNVELPEGVVRTKRGWRFLPRPIWKPLQQRKRKKDEPSNKELEMAERMALRKYVFKGLGKPFWFGYAGLCAAVSPSTLAVIQSNPTNPANPNIYFNEIESYVNTLPKEFIWNNQTIHIQKDLTDKLKQLQKYLKLTPLHSLDPRAMKEILPDVTPPSLMDSIETYSEMVGAEERGRDSTKLILGGALIIGILIFGILAMMMFFK